MVWIPHVYGLGHPLDGIANAHTVISSSGTSSIYTILDFPTSNFSRSQLRVRTDFIVTREATIGKKETDSTSIHVNAHGRCN